MNSFAGIVRFDDIFIEINVWFIANWKYFDWKRLHGYKPVPVYESMHLVYSSEIKLFTCCIVGHKSKKSAASQSFVVIFLKI